MVDKYDAFLDADEARIDAFLDDKQSIPQQKWDEKEAYRKAALEIPWLQRQAAAFATPFVGAYESAKELIGKGDPSEALAIKTMQEEAPIGTIAGYLAPGVGTARLFGAAPTVLGRIGQGAISGGAYGMLVPEGKEQATVMGKAEQGLSGAAIGGAFSGAFEGVKALGAGIRNIVGPSISKKQAELAAGRLVNKIAGKDTEQIIKLLRAGELDDTAVQAAIDAKNPAFSALQEAVAKANMPKEYLAVEAAQKAKQLGVTSKLARGATATESLTSRKDMLQKIEQALGPVREESLSTANIHNQVIKPLLNRADELEQQALTFGGTSAEASKIRNIAAQLSNQYKPLDVSAVTGKITTILQDPKLGSSENVENVLSGVTERIKSLTKAGGGDIDAHALYMMRKEGVNEVIDKLLAGRDPAITKKLSAKLSSELKPLIDDAIEASGAKNWKSYVSKYEGGFRAINRVELYDKLQSLLKTSPNEFVKVVRGDNPDIVRNITGSHDISSVLSQQNIAKLKHIASQIERDDEIAKQSTEGMRRLSKIMGSFEKPIEPVGMLDRAVVIANAAFRRIRGLGGEKLEMSLSDLMLPQNKEKLADVLSKASNREKNAFHMMLNSVGYTGAAYAGSRGDNQ